MPMMAKGFPPYWAGLFLIWMSENIPKPIATGPVNKPVEQHQPKTRLYPPKIDETSASD
jgi:hypothetical protein